MKGFILLLAAILPLFSVRLQAQDKKEKPTLEEQVKAVLPKISEKDLKAFVFSMSRNEPYVPGPDSKKQEGVPEGTVTKYHWVNKKFYIGTERDYWIYVPAQYDSSKPACLMVFMDGDFYLGPDCQANIVLDNLIHRKEIPVIIGLFINAGDKGPGYPIWGGTTNRCVEFDSVNDTWPRFLIEEIIPVVKEKYIITDDPAGRAIVGISSGGICAFNAAWQRPDVFGKVISHCGGFVNCDGGDRFPEMIRMSPKKPIRVFLQSGEKDMNYVYGSLALQNKAMAAALDYSGYDYKFVFGEGGHSLMHGGAIFPETLWWLWRDYPR